jgi:EmrB/QacA subfamily drug resistance transporter
MTDAGRQPQHSSDDKSAFVESPTQPRPVYVRHPREQRAVLLVATLAAFLTPFMGSSINIALPSIGREFSMNAILLGWVATSYLLAAAMFLVPFGKAADIYGRKRVFTAGLLLYTISSLFSAIATSGITLICFRALHGMAGAMIFGTGTAMLTSVFPAEERGRVLGINVAAVYTGLSLGPFLGGLLTQYLGWRSIFVINAILSTIVLGVIFRNLKGEWAEARGERFDFVGSIIYGLTIVTVMYGLSLLPGMLGVALVLLGGLGGLLFIRWEGRVESPLLNMQLFKENRVFAFSNLAALINYSATAAVAFLLSLYLQYVKELSPQSAGTILVAQPIVMAVFSPFAGRLSDRVESRIVASAAMGLTALGLALLTLLDANTAFGFIIASLILLGFGFALFSSPNTNAIMSSVEKRSYGVASATLGTMRLTGQMLSMGIALLIFAVFVGKVQITPERFPAFLAGLRTAFVIFAALCGGGIFASLARGKVREARL